MKDRRGNFGMMAGIMIPVLLLAAGLLIDGTSMITMRGRVQAAADAASLAAASKMVAEDLTVAEGKAFAAEFFHGQLSEDQKLFGEFTATPIVKVEDVSTGTELSWKVTVDASAKLPVSAFLKAAGWTTTNVEVESVSQSSSETKSAMSMMLVLDKSGSMADPSGQTTTVTTQCNTGNGWGWGGWGWGGRNRNRECEKQVNISKIDALKSAVASLLGQLDEADPHNQYVRTGMVSYDYGVDKYHQLVWGTSATANHAKQLEADGGTDSSGAFQYAYSEVTDSMEVVFHKNKSGQVPEKYIVFMTDGDNNYSFSDTYTKNSCDLARANDVHVFSVAFKAPSGGKALLKYCATDESYYYEAEDASSLIDAFESIGQKASEAMTRLTN